jgi:6,7-dimethyl-8-ribityllumazine synthase
MEQAIARAGGDTRDSGRHAAEAVLATLEVKRELAGRKARPGF